MLDIPFLCLDPFNDTEYFQYYEIESYDLGDDYPEASFSINSSGLLNKENFLHQVQRCSVFTVQYIFFVFSQFLSTKNWKEKNVIVTI